jgi:uncharacterized protein YqeY
MAARMRIRMSLNKRIIQELKAATKARDAVRMNTLRMLRAAIKNREIELRTELEDQEVLWVIRTQVNQHRDSIRHFKQAGRSDLTEKEEQELTILMSFMPEQLSEEAIAQMVTQVIEELDAKHMGDMGRVMKTLMAKLASSANGKLVNEIVRKQLSSSI